MLKHPTLLTALLLLTLPPPTLAYSICPGIPTPTSCTAISACHWCTFGSHSFCTGIAEQCPKTPHHPALNGYFFSTASFDVFNFTESADNTSIAIVSLNDTFTPTTITINGQHVTVKLSNEPVARSGFIEYLPPPSLPRIYWQSGGGSTSDGDVWESGTLPPPTTAFPLLFNATLFHNALPAMKGYAIYSITTDVHTGQYHITSINKTFSPTTAVGRGASGNTELVSTTFTSNTVTRGTLRSLGSGVSEFIWYEGAGTGQVVWRLGGTPPPPPPPPIETCSGNFNQDLCQKFNRSGIKCEWCVSNDKLDQLCFTSTHLPSNATWTCEAGRR